jgi:hypothetical protein
MPWMHIAGSWGKVGAWEGVGMSRKDWLVLWDVLWIWWEWRCGCKNCALTGGASVGILSFFSLCL